MKKILLTVAVLGPVFIPGPDSGCVAGDAGRVDLPDPITDADYRAAGRRWDQKVELGRLLFFDKVLSGNRNISCSTCHHPEHGTSDAVGLAFGEGATGLGEERKHGATPDTAVHERVPRNSPALFNLGAKEYTTMFHDGRVEVDENGYYESGFVSPARFKLPAGLDSVLAAQAMFPVTSPTEMAGQKGENEIADARWLSRVAGPRGVWNLLADRLRAIPEYVERFRRAFPGQVKSAGDVSFVLAANAIAAFEAHAFRADQSPFDRFLRDGTKLPVAAAAGMELFYGRAGCSKCHSGKFQTDHDFHGIAMPQIGPGKGDGRDASYWRETGIRAFLEDFGRGRVTVRPEDNYKFRTPSLRNVELTAPYGHAGTHGTLESVIRHHLAPVASLDRYEVGADALPVLDRVLELSATGDRMQHSFVSQQRLPGFLRRDTFVHSRPEMRHRIAAAADIQPVDLTDAQIGQLVAFLGCLTDPGSKDLTRWIPVRVPSGLQVED